MIRSFADSTARRLFEAGPNAGIRGPDSEPALMLLDVLDAAPALDALRALRIAGLRARDSAPPRWSMTIDARWRVTFRLRTGAAEDVQIQDLRSG